MADQRLTWLTRRPTLWSAAVPVVAIGAGVLFALSAATARGTDLRSTGGDLPGLIREQTRKNALAAEQVRRQRSDVDRLSAQSAPRDLRVTQLRTQADPSAVAAGTVAVSGPTPPAAPNDAKSVPS